MSRKEKRLHQLVMLLIVCEAHQHIVVTALTSLLSLVRIKVQRASSLTDQGLAQHLQRVPDLIPGITSKKKKKL